MSNYRNNSLDPRTLRTLEITGAVGFKVMEITNVPFTELTADEYHEWVKAWKQVYNALSELTRNVRNVANTSEKKFDQADVHSSQHHLRVLSNTMLNARHYARDVRRNLRQTA